MLKTAIELLGNKSKREMLSKNIKAMGKTNAANDIAEEVIKLAR
jgi:UDP-N-acetylglucosamine:LPS N-acetylglucosamine transferase